MRLPGVEIQPVIDGVAIRQGQRIEIADLGAVARQHVVTCFVAKRDARHVVQPVRAVTRQCRQQLRQRQLALADHDRVRARLEILGRVVRALGPPRITRQPWTFAARTTSSTERRVINVV